MQTCKEWLKYVFPRSTDQHIFLPSSQRGGDKDRDLTNNSDPIHGAFDLYIPRYLYCHVSKMSGNTDSVGRSVLVSRIGHTQPMNLPGGDILKADVKQSVDSV